MKRIGITLMVLAGALFLAGCTSETTETTTIETTTVVTTETTSEPTPTPKPTPFDVSKVTNIEISSPNVVDGVWETKITNTDKGENLSPELSWSPVEGAKAYAVYMIDTSANWLHMDAVTDGTSFALGQIDGTESNRYIGPYPSSTHTYVIYVVALKDNPGKVKKFFDNGDNAMRNYLLDLDVSESGTPGNIIGYGELSGTYTPGE